MLYNHINEVESVLLALSRIPAGSGHSLHKGTPREAFIEEFLERHLAQTVAIGTGEIIDANSEPKQQRNQIDIIIYRKEYPKIDFGGGISGYLAESVVATIEVKSTLDKDAIQQAIATARNIKALNRNFYQPSSGVLSYCPPSILSYVVAYDGPAKMETVFDWMNSVHVTEGIQYPAMGNTLEERLRVTCPSIDAVFVLGKGFIHFDNVPATCIPENRRKEIPKIKWAIANPSRGNLFLLFIFLTLAVSGSSGSILNPGPYLKNATTGEIHFAG